MSQEQRKWNHVGQIIKDEEGRYTLKLQKNVKLKAGTKLALFSPKEDKEYAAGNVKFNVSLSSYFLNGNFAENVVKDFVPSNSND